jgi:hypothetical protein
MRFITKAVLSVTLLQAVFGAPAREHNNLDVVRTVTLANGQVIDWVRADSQGHVAPLPPQHKNVARDQGTDPKDFFVPIPKDLYGPDGTVPLPRDVSHAWPEKIPPPFNVLDQDKGDFRANNFAAQIAVNQHWYASAATLAKSTGVGATFSKYKPYLESRNDFSLLQFALIRQDAEHADYGKVLQTLEAGWMYYPPKASNPQLFTFFNVNGYRQQGDYQGGFNRDYRGWVQVDRDIYPGIEYNDFSVVNGKQLEMDLKYHLHDGNWWLRAFGKDIGYYPASLFSKNVDAEKTLAGFADRVDVYGEVFNSGQAITTSDMGSGEFADKGDKKSAYIRNIVSVDPSGNDQDYSAGVMESDHERYRIQSHWRSGTSWKSYCYVGGPGAGGVVGG